MCGRLIGQVSVSDVLEEVQRQQIRVKEAHETLLGQESCQECVRESREVTSKSVKVQDTPVSYVKMLMMRLEAQRGYN